MKIAVKAKPETQKQLHFRVPASLKDAIDATRTLADQLGVDYNATIVDLIAQANGDLHAQLAARVSASGNKVGNEVGNGVYADPVTKSDPLPSRSVQ
jgi:hypothetical protein